MCFLNEKKIRKKRRCWTKNWLQERNTFSHMRLIRELRVNEPGDYKNFLRMNEACFDELLSLVTPAIERQNTNMRQGVSAEERLIATLRFLATGMTYEDLKYTCAMSPQLLGKVIPETCQAICNVLKDDYLKLPSTAEGWMQIAKGFNESWQFENCLGAMDGRHMAIKAPRECAAYYYNYKGFCSVVLFAIVNANYEFIYVHCGTNGRISDEGVLEVTDFNDMLEGKRLNIPSPVSYPNKREIILPVVFIGDEAFPLKENLMKPYSNKVIVHDEKIFNYRLCRARRVVENAFGIMTSRFRCLLGTLGMDLCKVDIVVLSCCVLHNYLRKKSSTYLTSGSVDSEDTTTGIISEGEWRKQTTQLFGLQRTRQGYKHRIAEAIRDSYKVHYNNEGRVHFQDKLVNRR